MSMKILSHQDDVVLHPLRDISCWFTAVASAGVAVEEDAAAAAAAGGEFASMAFTLYSLIQTAILCTNAIAVLHEERFLSKSERSVVFYTRFPHILFQMLDVHHAKLC